MTVVTAADVVITEQELAAHTIPRSALVNCAAAFIDCRTPGSESKENYALIGPGVSQSATQFVNLREPHGFNIGAAAMPHGVTNNLHLHFTAEVFFNLGGQWLFRWGVDGGQGEYRSIEGDVLSVPTWIFRGFTNVGPDDGILFTALGGDDPGGIIWGPSVLAQAAEHGLYLSRENRMLAVDPGEPAPDPDLLVRPMPAAAAGALRRYPVAEMARRVSRADQRTYSDRPFLCSTLPGGRAAFSAVIGHGLTEDRDQEPAVTNPHGFAVAALRAGIGQGLLRHRHDATVVVLVRSGRWRVVLNDPARAQTVELGSQDTLSVPPGSWRTLECLDEDGEVFLITGGDGRVRIDWAPEVVAAAAAQGVCRDSNGYVAAAALVAQASPDD